MNFQYAQLKTINIKIAHPRSRWKRYSALQSVTQGQNNVRMARAPSWLTRWALDWESRQDYRLIQPLQIYSRRLIFWLGGVCGQRAPSWKQSPSGISSQNRTSVSSWAVCSVTGFWIGLALRSGLASFRSVPLYGDRWAFCLCELLAAWWRIWHDGVAASQSC